MSPRRESESWFEALGGLSDYDSNVGSVRSSVAGDSRLAFSGHSNRNGSRSVVSAELPRQKHNIQSASSSMPEPDSAASDIKTPTISGSTRKRVESEKEARARMIHRAGAFEALCKAEKDSEEPPAPPSKDPGQLHQHPSSMRPGSAAQGPAPVRVASRHTEAAVSGTPTVSPPWTPQKLVYAQASSGQRANNGEAAVRDSLYKAYQPPPPVPPKDKKYQQRAISSEQSGGKRRPPPLDLHKITAHGSQNREASRGSTISVQPSATSSNSQSGIRSGRSSKPYEVNHNRNSRASSNSEVPKRVYKAYTPSATPSPSPSLSTSTSPFTFPAQVRRLLTPPGSPSSPLSPPSPSHTPSYSAASAPPSHSPYPSPQPSPRSSLSRSRSPARGSWTADRPQQKRSSFVDRARDRLKAGWHLNLQKAGLRPLDSFRVHGVVRSPGAEDAAASPVRGGRPGERRREGGSEDKGRRSADLSISGLEGRARRHRLRQSQREGEGREEGREIRRGREVEGRARAVSFGGGATRLERADSLFLGGVDRPVSGTFFASDWAQQQAQDMVAMFPASSSLHRGPSGEKDRGIVAQKQRKTGYDSSPRLSEQVTSSAQGPGTPSDNRRELPSQTQSSKIPVPSQNRARRGSVDPMLSRRHASTQEKSSRRLK
ncbi:hypothetical protein F4781DRAFT_445345 [Annulohypoxylon bovei var. microspora]|nr:hypothetical protein F4781DRAFT_445345 [Annulohypoxylon bovei var. microspora]